MLASLVRVTHESAAHGVLGSVQRFPGTWFVTHHFCCQVEPEISILGWAFCFFAFSYFTKETDRWFPSKCGLVHFFIEI